MKSINSFILERLKLNKNTQISKGYHDMLLVTIMASKAWGLYDQFRKFSKYNSNYSNIYGKVLFFPANLMHSEFFIIDKELFLKEIEHFSDYKTPISSNKTTINGTKIHKISKDISIKDFIKKMEKGEIDINDEIHNWEYIRKINYIEEIYEVN